MHCLSSIVDLPAQSVFADIPSNQGMRSSTWGKGWTRKAGPACRRERNVRENIMCIRIRVKNEYGLNSYYIKGWAKVG